MIKVNNILKGIKYLPPFPGTVSKVLLMLENPNVTVDTIVDIIKFDQAIASNVLKLCNSSYFGLSRSVTNLEEALVYIGLSRFRVILVLSGTRQFFKKKMVGYELYRGEIWRCSLSSAVVADELCNLFPIETREEIILAALLHDIGKLLLSEYISDSMSDIYEMVEKKGIPFVEAEKEIIGCDHAELGARILDMWNFSDSIVNAVRKHHESVADEDTLFENIIRLTDTVVIMMGYGTSVDGLAYHGFDDVCLKYDITQELLDGVMSDSLEKIQNVEKKFGITREDILHGTKSPDCR